MKNEPLNASQIISQLGDHKHALSEILFEYDKVRNLLYRFILSGSIPYGGEIEIPEDVVISFDADEERNVKVEAIKLPSGMSNRERISYHKLKEFLK